MELSADARLAFPQPVVFAAYRDKLVVLLPFLLNVRGIEEKLRIDADGVARLVNEWLQPNLGEVSRGLAKYVEHQRG